MLLQRRESLGLDSESIRLVEVIHQRFVLAGAKLAQADKAKLKVLNTEVATLTTSLTSDYWQQINPAVWL